MSSSRAPSNHGMCSLTRIRRASMPSVPSMMSATRPSHRARVTLPWTAASTMSRARTAPLAVYRCTAAAPARCQPEVVSTDPPSRRRGRPAKELPRHPAHVADPPIVRDRRTFAYPRPLRRTFDHLPGGLGLGHDAAMTERGQRDTGVLQSVERALRVLDHVAASPTRTVPAKDVAQALGLP